MLCTQCGNDNPVSNRFCGSCGAKLEAPAASELVSESKSRPVAPSLDMRDPTDPGRIVVPANGRNDGHARENDYVAVRDHDAEEVPATTEPVAHEVGPTLDAPEAYRGEEQVRAEPIEPVHYMAASGEVTSRELPPPRRDVSVHGPSLLGLNDDYVAESTPMRDTTDYSYLYDEEGGGGRTVNWRLMFALLILIGFGGVMIYMWKQGKSWNTAIIHDITGKFGANDQKASESKAVVSPQNNDSNTVAKVGPTTPGGPEIAVGATPNNIPANTTPQSDQAADKNKSADASKSTDGTKPKDSSASNSATTPSNPLDDANAKGAAASDPKNAKAENIKPADAKAVADNDAKQAKASDKNADTGDEEDADTPAPSATKRAAAAATTKSAKAAKSKKGFAARSATADDEEADDVALVHRADSLLKARSCNQAVDMFREAALHGNATARSRLGGLYATGHCVPLDRAEAYNWFTLAKDAGAHYKWIEHNRSMLWAQMSERERERVMRR